MDRKLVQLKHFEIYAKEPFQLMSAEMIGEKIRDSKFFDLDFPPLESSVYETYIDSPFDIVIHWRRPEEFLKPNYELGTLMCVVFQDSCEPSDLRLGILANEWFLSAVAILAERPELIERLFVTSTINKHGVY